MIMGGAAEPVRDPPVSPQGRSPADGTIAFGIEWGSERAWRLGLAIAWLVAIAYVLPRLDRGWIPNDEGVLAQGAERVLLGEVPHRDFAEVYTGGLDYLNALGFRVLGIHLMALRYVLFGFFVLWVPVIYYIASRWTTPFGAAAVTLLSALWTVPNYPAAMPSWYNLFFATFGAAALMRFLEVKGRRWLVLAGLMGGCSILAKVAGLYYVAACLLFLLVHEGMTQEASKDGRAGWGHRCLLALGLVGFLVALVHLVRGRVTAENVYHFIVPGTALALLTWRVSVGPAALPTSRRLARLASLVWPFLLGLTIPIAIFVAHDLTAGGINALLRGVFVSPTTRFLAASRPALEWPAVVPALLLAGILLVGIRAGRGMRVWVVGMAWAALFVGARAIGGAEYLTRIGWASVSQAIPLVVVGGLAVLVRRRTNPPDRIRWEQSFLLLAVAGLTSLVEFPYSAPVYFCYTAPLALLALLSTLRLVGGPPQPLAGLLAAYYAGFAVLTLNSQTVDALGLAGAHRGPLARLELARGGLLVPVEEAAEYQAVVDTLTAHAQGSFTYAGPDAPEVYFLSGLRNPTRTFFDFLEPGDHSTDRVLSAVDRHAVTAVVINRFVKFSGKLGPDLEAAFAMRFPHVATIGRFTVRWR